MFLILQVYDGNRGYMGPFQCGSQFLDFMLFWEQLAVADPGFPRGEDANP